MTTGYKVISSSGAIKSGNGILYAITLTGGSDAATLTLYDELSGSGDQMVATIKAATNTTVHLIFPGGIVFGIGCYATITGTSPSVSASYI